MNPLLRQFILSLCPLLCLAATPESATTARPLHSGIARANMDTAVRPQDDFYRYTNGTWLRNIEIPADKSGWGAFAELREATLPRLQALIEAAELDKGDDARKIGNLYISYMDIDKRNALELKPLAEEFAKIAATQDKSQIPALIAYFQRLGASAPYHIGVQQDARDSTRYIVALGQGGLGMPDRDYYLNTDDEKLAAIRGKYQAHMATMLTLAGDPAPEENAKAILALETQMAKIQWTKVENRDPIKTYNRVELAELKMLMPGYAWETYLKDSGIAEKVSYMVVAQPSYFTGLSQILNDTPMATWRAYFTLHIIRHYAPYLSEAASQAEFDFSGKVLRGVPEQEPQWKRAVRLVNDSMGEALGKLYVERHFPSAYKARMEKLVSHLLAAYRQSIDTLDWMSPSTRKEAQAKLAALRTKIAYPDKWRDYSKLLIGKDDLIGNLRNSAGFEYQFEIDKLGRPIDREEWVMTPQTVNAYFNPALNEIVFPASILQPPFFDPEADDAVNYGGIGAVIGHEISHGFDDKGSQYDGLGNLRDWWAKEDHEKFAKKTAALVTQYGGYNPLPGYRINGELTLGENIADNSGIAIAYKAYQLSLNNAEAPLIDGFTGDQRFFLGFAQVWRGKLRDQQSIVQLKTDPHSPSEFRGNGTLKNQASFYKAFGIKAGDKMYLPPEQRVTIW